MLEKHFIQLLILQTCLEQTYGYSFIFFTVTKMKKLLVIKCNVWLRGKSKQCFDLSKYLA